ncbi:MAG: hypothetical protein ACXWRE_16055 [Pseudobdellovibrionaceae bacterium]
MLIELTQRTDFYDVWSRFVSTGDIKDVPLNIRQSWERCQKADIDPRKEMTFMKIDQNSIRKRIDEQSDLHQILQTHYKNIEKYFSFLPLVIFFSDRDGYILSIAGDDKVLKLLGQAMQTAVIGVRSKNTL